MKLLIVRHAETVENANKIIQGVSCGTLSERGIYQAKRIALRLANEKIDKIYTSDLERTVMTAREIAKYHPSIPFILTENLRERSFGKYEGKPWPGYRVSDRPDVESFESVYKRVGKFLDEIENYDSETILAVVHGGSMLALFVHLLNKSAEEIKANNEAPDNASLSIFDPVPYLKLYNCTKHLE